MGVEFLRRTKRAKALVLCISYTFLRPDRTQDHFLGRTYARAMHNNTLAWLPERITRHIAHTRCSRSSQQRLPASSRTASRGGCRSCAGRARDRLLAASISRTRLMARAHTPSHGTTRAGNTCPCGCGEPAATTAPGDHWPSTRRPTRRRTRMRAVRCATAVRSVATSSSSPRARPAKGSPVLPTSAIKMEEE